MAVERFYVDISTAITALTEMSKAGRKLRPAFAKMRGPLRVDQKDHASDEAGPSGKWPGLSARTLAKRQSEGRRRHLGKKRSRGGIYRKTRKLLGKLPGAFRVSVTDQEIRATWKAPWSDVHNAGGKGGNNAKEPQRQFAWISDTLVKVGASIIVAHVIAGFGKGGR
jgi:hypothetical protein